MAYEFEWDAKKAADNLRKHGVSFDEAVTAFGDPLSILLSDPSHSVVKSDTSYWACPPQAAFW